MCLKFGHCTNSEHTTFTCKQTGNSSIRLQCDTRINFSGRREQAFTFRVSLRRRWCVQNQKTCSLMGESRLRTAPGESSLFLRRYDYYSNQAVQVGSGSSTCEVSKMRWSKDGANSSLRNLIFKQIWPRYTCVPSVPKLSTKDVTRRCV